MVGRPFLYTQTSKGAYFKRTICAFKGTASIKMREIDPDALVPCWAPLPPPATSLPARHGGADILVSRAYLEVEADCQGRDERLATVLPGRASPVNQELSLDGVRVGFKSGLLSLLEHGLTDLPWRGRKQISCRMNMV